MIVQLDKQNFRLNEKLSNYLVVNTLGKSKIRSRYESYNQNACDLTSNNYGDDIVESQNKQQQLRTEEKDSTFQIQSNEVITPLNAI